MIRNLLLTTGIVLFASFMAFAQPGTLKGKLLDGKSKEPVPFANIVLEVGGTQIGGTSSDFDGNYTIKPIPPGTYDLKASSVGFQPVMIQGIVIKAGKIEFLDVEMASSDVVLEEFVVIDYKVPLIDKDKTQNDVTVTAEEIAKMPNRNAASIATTVGGVFSEDGERGSIRGARSEETVTFIDGVKVIGSSNLPASALEQVSVMLGGTPAMYGDVTGGVISITTKGPSREFSGGLELQTSQFLDPYGYNSAEFNLTGPLFKGKEESSTALLGFFLAGNVIYNQHNTRAAGGIDKATDEYQEYLHNTPVRQGLGLGIYQNAEFMTADQMENVDATPNTSNFSTNLSMKIDVKTSKNTNLTFGGTFNYSKFNNFSYRNSMFNWDNNSLTTDYTWRAYGKFTQRFDSDPESTSLFKNFFYSIQVDYSQRHWKNESEKFEDDLFKYKKVLVLFLLLVFVAPSIAMAETLTVPKGTKLNLVLDENVTFETLVGKEFALHSKSDYIKLGKTLLPKNTLFLGKLEEIKSAKRLSKSGKMLFTINTFNINGEYKPIKTNIVAINNKKIKSVYKARGGYWKNFTSHVFPLNKVNLSCTPEQQYNNECAFFFPALLAPILLGVYVVSIPYGLVFASVVKGNEAFLKKNTVIKIQLEENLNWNL